MTPPVPPWLHPTPVRPSQRLLFPHCSEDVQETAQTAGVPLAQVKDGRLSPASLALFGSVLLPLCRVQGSQWAGGAWAHTGQSWGEPLGILGPL